MEPGVLALFIFFLIIAAIASGAEVALISLSPAKVRAMVEEKLVGSQAVSTLIGKPHRLLITILIVYNLLHTGLSVFAAAWATAVFGSEVLGIVTGVITFVILIFGEIIPKTFAQKFPSQTSRFIAPTLLVVTYLLFPITWVLEMINKGMMKLLRVKDQQKLYSDSEFLALADIGAEEGGIEEDEREMIENVLEFGDTTVEQVMTPRPEVEMLPSTATIEEAVAFVVERGRSRVPIYGESRDHVIGILKIHELLRQMETRGKEEVLGNLEMKEPLFVPETKPVDELFKEFQWKRIHIAMVVDEHGSISGIVTLEDLLEELVGDIMDENEVEERLLVKLNASSWSVSGKLELEMVAEETGLELPDDLPEHKTVAFLVLDQLEKIPKRGDDFEFAGFHFIVEKMVGNRIERVRMMKTSQE